MSPSPSLWRVVLLADLAPQRSWAWENYAVSSIDATLKALAWLGDTLRAQLPEGAPLPKIRVLEVLQVTV